MNKGENTLGSKTATCEVSGNAIEAPAGIGRWTYTATAAVADGTVIFQGKFLIGSRGPTGGTIWQLQR